MPPLSADWERVDVSAWAVLRVEKAGSSPATWLEEPGTRRKWLHKDTVIPSSGVEQGEDWSEVVSTQIGQALGVPCATTRLCLRHGRRGSLSLNVIPDGHSLWDGVVALEQCPDVTDYYPHIEGSPGVNPLHPEIKRPGHRLENIQLALEGAVAPPDFTGPSYLDAFDVFCGYLVFDALVANRDRHEQNWALLMPGLLTAPVCLAPTYDHASSLGYNLRDGTRLAKVEQPEHLAAWAERGTAWRYEHVGKPPALVELAVDALNRCSAAAADYWRGQVRQLDLSWVNEELGRVAIPEMSDEAAMFASALVRHNLERLNNAI